MGGSYMLGRNRKDNSPDGFHFTGFDQVSPPDVLDILVFYENQDCAREGRDVSEIPDLPQDQIWEVYNLTESQTEGLCEFVLECQPNGGNADYPVAHSGVHLGNFNYDIARSVQTYTVPIYGLEQDQTVTFPITDMVPHQDAQKLIIPQENAQNQTWSLSTKTEITTVFLNTFNLNQYKWIASHHALCQYITRTITLGIHHHHGILKKITNQLLVKTIQCLHSKIIYHEK